MNRSQKDQIKQLRTKGYSYSKIATSLGISLNTVKSFCQRNGLSGRADLLKENPIIIDVCHQCGKPLNQTPGKKKKLFCSDKCRMAWWNSHPEAVKRKQFQTFTCPICGLTFKVYGSRERKYCSRACYGKSKVKSL